MSDNVQQIKERLNITDIISGYIRLTKAGVNYKALCPFHNEKTPSFMVSPSRQSWHCFGCGEGGDIFTFIQKIENIEFPETLKILAEKAGVILERSDPKMRSEKDRLYEICEMATEFFTSSLNNSVLNYLKNRGLNEETISEWRLGYAPDSWEQLLTFLRNKGFKENEIEKAGLILRNPRNHDKFRNRLMFPICDNNGRVIAFSGRMLNDVIPSKTEKPDSGKYINSPETILYSKSRTLYGLDRAKSEVRKSNKVVIVEGQMDMLLPWQDGVKNVVATSGTALTEEQLLILKRLTSDLVLAFDIDEAGFRATKRGVDLAAELGFNISVIDLPDGKDPADFVKNNPGKFINLINVSEPILKYYFNQVFRKFSKEESDIKPENKKLIALALLSEIKRLPSSIERSNWIRELSLRIGVSESDLKEEMEFLTTSENQRSFEQPQHQKTAIKTRKEILSERILALLLKKPDLIAEAIKSAPFMLARDLEFLTAFSQGNGNFSEIRSAISVDSRSRLDFLYLLGDYELDRAGSDFDVSKEIAFMVKEIEREHYKELLVKIGNEIKNSEALGKNSDNLTKEFQNISKRLHQLNSNEKTKKI